MYAITVDADRALLTIRHERFYELADIDRYLVDLRAAFAMLPPGRPYRLLIDITSCVLQSQEALRSFAAHAGEFPRAERIAVATGNSLARRQMRRVLDRDYLAYFDTLDEAKAWLSEAPAARG